MPPVCRWLGRQARGVPVVCPLIYSMHEMSGVFYTPQAGEGTQRLPIHSFISIETVRGSIKWNELEGVLFTSALYIVRFAIIRVRTMPYPSLPLTKRRITIEPQARRCMEHLGITADEVLITMNEWESSSVVATDPLTANTLAAYPETAEEIPAFYEVERTFPGHRLTLTIFYSTSVKP